MKYLILVAVSLPFLAFGQNSALDEIDSERQRLLTIVEQTEVDSIKVRAYFDLYQVVRFQYPREGLHCCEKADSICQLNLGKTLDQDHRLWFLKIHSSILKGIGNYHGRRGDADAALPYFEQSLILAEELNDEKYIASALTNVANISFLKGDLGKAIEGYTEALRINEKIKYDRGISSTLVNIAAVYQTQGDYEKSVEYIKQAYALDKKVAPKRWGRIALYVSENLLKANQPEEAKKYLDEGMEQAIKVGDRQTRILGLTMLADFSLSKAELDSAALFCLEAYNMSVDFDNPGMIAKSAAQLAQVYFKKGSYAQSLKYSAISLEIAQENQLLASIRDAAKWRFKSFEAIGQDNKALAAYKTFVAAEDSISSQESQRKVLFQEFQYSYDKKVLADSIRIQNERHLQETKLRSEEAKTKRNKMLAYSALGTLLLAFIFILVLRKQKKKIAFEQHRSDQLLLNILPEEVAEELKDRGRTQAKQYKAVSVLFTDFVGFTKISSQLSAKDLVVELNACFEAFDHIVGKYEVEKIKTIGDAYMAAGGISEVEDDAVKNTIKAALEMQEYIMDRKAKSKDGLCFTMRVGVHQGPVVAGVVGVKKFQYDLWGDTVNTASRMESNGEVGKVNISDATYQVIKDDAQFVFESREPLQVKGKGEMKMWFVSLR